MDGLIAILSVIAGILAVVAGTLPQIEHKKLKDDNTSRTSTNQTKLDQS